MNKTLIILDLDESLFHCDILSFDNYEYKFTLDNDNTYYAMKRPYVDEFITYIKENYEYGVYTAASEDYALEHCKVLDLNPKFLLHQNNCIISTDRKTYNKYFLKELCKLEEFSSLSNMIAIDDRFESFSEDPDNLIKIEPFYCNKKDNVLLRLIDYLESIKGVVDVRTIDKSNWYKK